SNKEGRKMTVSRVSEVIGHSTKSWDDAIETALGRAAKTLRNIETMEVKSQEAKVKDGKITEYRVKVNIYFVLEN
ncbi:MAG: dodecin family protein, partial [Proteobacteria bacterium]|nr:dodecin family protein [Pseudomonadota bacterium]